MVTYPAVSDAFGLTSIGVLAKNSHLHQIKESCSSRSPFRHGFTPGYPACPIKVAEAPVSSRLDQDLGRRNAVNLGIGTNSETHHSDEITVKRFQTFL